jgi:TATA-box binding protein (TBP) (component of TFIID and TFIIIB)
VFCIYVIDEIDVIAKNQGNHKMETPSQQLSIVPSVRDQADAFDKELNNTIEHLTNSDVKVSTITLLVVLKYGIDLQLLSNMVPSDTIQQFIQDVMGCKEAITIRTKSVSFNNSVMFSIKTNDTHTQVVKVFCNGNLHITGMKSVSDGLYISEVFATMFELIIGENGLNNTYQITDFTVQLINFYFNISLPSAKVICLCTLSKLITANTGFYCQYNNEHHPGVIIKCIGYTILVFETGNILLSAITLPSQLLEAHTFIYNMIMSHINNICTDSSDLVKQSKKGRPKKKNVFDYGQFIVLK